MSVADDTPVALRRWRCSDAPWCVECSREQEIQRFSADRADLTPADVAASIEASRADADRDAFLICSAGRGRRLGNLAVEYFGRTAHVSYWVAADARGRRVAANALVLLLQSLRREQRVDAVELWAHAENIGSQRAAERAGFVRDPAADRERVVKKVVRPTVAYRFDLDVP
ncbi:MAG: GNAT family N-acetyltransferase [Jatrophihabitantaceae bacterium]